eukprot:1995617-Rhodomonas_salina.1
MVLSGWPQLDYQPYLSVPLPEVAPDAISGADIAFAILCICYAMSSTDMGCAATPRHVRHLLPPPRSKGTVPPRDVRYCYAMS